MTRWRLYLLSLCFAMAASVRAEPPLTLVDAEGNALENAVVAWQWPNAEAPAPLDQPAQMIQRDRQFIPHVMVVPEGSEVDFPNRDNTRHHVYSVSPAKTFDIKLYADRPDDPILFDRTGIVVLGCNIHDHMKAYIVVTDAPRWALSDENGRIQPPSRPDDASGITARVWHPWQKRNAAWQDLEWPPDNQTLRLDVTAPKPRKTPMQDLQQRFNNLAQ